MKIELTRKQKKYIIEILKNFIENPNCVKWSYEQSDYTDYITSDYNGTRFGISRSVYSTNIRYRININSVEILKEDCYFYHSKIARLARKIISTQAKEAGGCPEVIKTNKIERAINEAREKYLVEKLSGI